MIIFWWKQGDQLTWFFTLIGRLEDVWLHITYIYFIYNIFIYIYHISFFFCIDWDLYTVLLSFTGIEKSYVATNFLFNIWDHCLVGKDIPVHNIISNEIGLTVRKAAAIIRIPFDLLVFHWFILISVGHKSHTNYVAEKEQRTKDFTTLYFHSQHILHNGCFMPFYRLSFLIHKLNENLKC